MDNLNLHSYMWYVSDQGPRPSQEDVVFQQMFKIENKKNDLAWIVGVADGHSGDGVSRFLQHYIPKSIINIINTLHKKFPNDRFLDLHIIQDKIIDVVKSLDNEFLQYKTGCCELQKQRDPGAVLSFYVVYNSNVLVFQLGDSRILIFNENGKCIFETPLHDVSNESEVERIRQHCKNKDFFICNSKFFSIIAPSRVIGDLDVKKSYPEFLLNEPEVSIIPIDQPLFLFAFTDGIDATENMKVFKNYVKKVGVKDCVLAHTVNKIELLSKILENNTKDNKTISFQSFT